MIYMLFTSYNQEYYHSYHSNTVGENGLVFAPSTNIFFNVSDLSNKFIVCSLTNFNNGFYI
jgi:hypothetical protein